MENIIFAFDAIAKTQDTGCTAFKFAICVHANKIPHYYRILTNSKIGVIV